MFLCSHITITSNMSGLGLGPTYNAISVFMLFAMFALIGYIGCFPTNNATGDFSFTYDQMTVTLCIEACYGTPKNIYYYKYAAVSNNQCHCFTDIFDSTRGMYFGFY